MNYQQVTYKLPHLTIRGVRGGTPGAPFLLLLHGWLDNCHSFLPMAPYLDKYDWVAVDFAGHGHSDHRGVDAHYYFVDWVDDIQQLIQQQGWKDIHLAGHSMGGYVAQTLAAAFPEAIRSLLTIEAFGMVVNEAADTLLQLREGLLSRRKYRQQKPRVYSDLEHLNHARAKAGEFEIELAQLLLQRNLRQVDGGFAWRTDRRVRGVSPFRYTAEQVVPVLSAIQAPFHLILGQQGHPSLNKAISAWATSVSNFSHETIPGGHHLHMQYPHQVASAVARQFAGAG